jgi:hypothetical protein
MVENVARSNVQIDNLKHTTRKMAFKQSLYLRSFSSYELFQKSTLNSTTKSNPPHPRLAAPQAYFVGLKKQCQQLMC